MFIYVFAAGIDFGHAIAVGIATGICILLFNLIFRSIQKGWLGKLFGKLGFMPKVLGCPNCGAEGKIVTDGSTLKSDNEVVRAKPDVRKIAAAWIVVIITGFGMGIYPILFIPCVVALVWGVRYYFSRPVVECKACGWKQTA